ncbi:metallophosphoesterase family protein [Thalassobellus sediminis]|uniref:metallophosphoesterase family protein n=1 Tax=Thalassobellus sediminis TaxID=3367753 RepID=UPI0037A920A6
MSFLLRCFSILLLLITFSCEKEESNVFKKQQIAFIADAHFADIYGEFQDASYKGIKNPVTGEYANIRTMSSQLQSTRIFNENYFAFITALNDIVNRGIKIVALPGDFSDDGQPIHIRGLRRILTEYSKKHDISFYVTTGNHDAVRPFTQEAKKTDFLGKGGKEQIITSVKTNSISKENELEPIVTFDIKNWGYKDMMLEMVDFGFFPKKNDLYWETPFSKYNYETYNFDLALKESVLEKRVYTIYETNLSIPDASYLVEPVKDVWLLAIDANVYVPKEDLSRLKDNPKDFSGASIGYNNVLLYKRHLIDWVKSVSEQAKKKGKILIAFSHYPMVDFNDDASTELKQFFGDNKMQLHRVPDENVAKIFADSGINIHFGGHMHINDTGVRTTKKGNTLYNIQTPSLAAYTPAYKILTIHSNAAFEVETVVIDSVKNYSSLFPFYKEEYAYLQETMHFKIWNKNILDAKTYKEFTEWHLKELVRLRFLPNDFQVDFLETFVKASGKDLLLLNTSEHEVVKIKEQLLKQGLELSSFSNWSGFDMIFDFYKLRSADQLAIPEVGVERLKQYHLVCEQLNESQDENLVLWSRIFQKTLKGQPSNHFKINLISNKIESINP